MPKSLEPEPPPRRRSYARRVLGRLSEAAIAFALIFAVWVVLLGFGPPVFEATALLGTPEGVKLTSAQAEGLGVRLVTPADFVLGYPTFTEDVYGLASADGRRLRVHCRAESRPRAISACAGIVRASGLVSAPYLALEPVRGDDQTQTPLSWPAVAEAVLGAALSGLACALLLALLPSGAAKPGASRRPVEAAPPTPPSAERPSGPRPSSAPPQVQIFTMPPEGSRQPVASRAPQRPSAPRRPVATPNGGSAPPTGAPSIVPAVPESAVSARPIGTIVLGPDAVIEPGPVEISSRVSVRPQGGPSQPPLNGRPPGGSLRPAPGAYDSIPAPAIPEGPLVRAVPVLDFIPHQRLVRTSTDERFHALASRLTWNADEDPSVVGITGAEQSAAKPAMLAARLAFAIAATGKARVLLMEADFEEPQLHRVLRLEALPQAGFSQQLQARLGHAHREPYQVQRCAPRLDVLLESRFRAHRAASVPSFGPAIDVFRLHYDVVIATLPPLAAGSRVADMAYLCDGIVAVVPRGIEVRSVRERALQLVSEERLYALVEDTELGERVTLPPSR